MTIVFWNKITTCTKSLVEQIVNYGEVGIMHVGYARTSTVEQEAGFEDQIRRLEAEGCEKIFQEQVSSIAEREKLKEALYFVREGDTLIVTKLDRLARSIRDLMSIVDQLKEKGVGLTILDPRLDTKGATGEFMLTIFGAVAQLEREMMLERQRVGIAKAKADGKYKGRAPTARRKADEIMALSKQGIRKADIARSLGIGRTSVYRVLTEMEAQEAALHSSS